MSDVNSNDQQAGKEAAKFERNMHKLVALFSGAVLFKKPRIQAGEDLTNVIAELVKEEKDALIAEFKTKAKGLIKRKQEFDKFVADQKKSVAKSIEEKQKEFNKEMEGIFGFVEKIEAIESSYYKSLKDLNEDATPTADEATETSTTSEESSSN